MAEVNVEHCTMDIIGPGFFYEEEEEARIDEGEVENEGIADRVVGQRGHCH